MGPEAARGCVAARVAEAAAARVLGPQHHEWMAWVTAAIVLAEATDDTELLLSAYRKREGALVAERAEDADIFVRFNHALVLGLETEDAADLLHTAYALDR